MSVNSGLPAQSANHRQCYSHSNCCTYRNILLVAHIPSVDLAGSILLVVHHSPAADCIDSDSQAAVAHVRVQAMLHYWSRRLAGVGRQEDRIC